jgi:hypothetical protein
MLYMLSLIDQEPNWEEVSPGDMQAMVDEMGKYNDELKEAGVMVDGHGLRGLETASVVRFSEGGESTVTDGPFAETKEQLMGFWIVEAANLDEALEWTRKAPIQEGAIEVRPLVEEQGEEDEKFSAEKILSRVKDPTQG